LKFFLNFAWQACGVTWSVAVEPRHPVVTEMYSGAPIFWQVNDFPSQINLKVWGIGGADWRNAARFWFYSLSCA
jgi:hypothetical protein